MTEILWLSDTVLMARCMNRVQDHQKIFIIKKGTDLKWTTQLTRDEKYQDGAWINFVFKDLISAC
jgi:hypothetical protein